MRKEVATALENCRRFLKELVCSRWNEKAFFFIDIEVLINMPIYHSRQWQCEDLTSGTQCAFELALALMQSSKRQIAPTLRSNADLLCHDSHCSPIRELA